MKSQKYHLHRIKIYDDLCAQLKDTFEKEINDRGCVGSIAEIYDSIKPFEPKGAISQAWSVAEVFRLIY